MFVPSYGKAEQKPKVHFDDPVWETIYRPSEEFVEKVRQDYLATTRSRSAGTNHACNCVLWAQAQGLGISGYGAAKNYPVNSNEPADWGFVVTYEGYYGHMAKYVRSGLYLLLTEANYQSCHITSSRIIPISDPLIKGYINP